MCSWRGVEKTVRRRRLPRGTVTAYLLIAQHEVQSGFVAALGQLIADERPAAFALGFHDVIGNDPEKAHDGCSWTEKNNRHKRAGDARLLGRLIVRVTDFGRVRAVVQNVTFRDHGAVAACATNKHRTPSETIAADWKPLQRRVVIGVR